MLKQNIRTDWKHLYGADMEQLGNVFELAYKRGYNMPTFVQKFMNCKIREVMDEWHPALSNGPSHDIVDIFIRDFGPLDTDDDFVYPENSMRWIGNMYGYLMYFTSLTSKEIYKELPFEDMLQCYTVGHEMSFEGYAERLCGLS